MSELRMTEASEAWKPVVGYEGMYEVSDHGQVRSLDRTIQCKDGRTQRWKGRMLKPGKTRSGHLTVSLCREGKQRIEYVHRLVLEAFVGKCPDGKECLHGDGNPANNRVENLRWDSRSENALDIVRHGCHHLANRTHCPRGHELLLGNTRKSERKKGHRSCLACHRACAYIHRHPELSDQFQQVSDQYYENILKGELKPWSIW